MNYSLKANQTATLTLDFDAHESIKENGRHNYTLEPVIIVMQE